MTTPHGGEPETLAPVTPLFGDRAPLTTPSRKTITRALPDRPRRPVAFTEDTDTSDEDGQSRTMADDSGDVAPTASTAPTASADGGPRSRRRVGEVATAPGVDSHADADSPLDRDVVVEKARTALTRSLGRRGLSIAEARSKLRASGLDAEETDAAIEDFVARGWLDDALLAEQLVHGATTRKDMGSRAVRQLLVKRLVARDVVDTVVAELPDDDVERAREFATAKARSLIRYDDDTATRRLMGQLARRGFGGSVAGRAAREALAAARAEAGDTGVRFR